jgi:hypothetical protein
MYLQMNSNAISNIGASRNIDSWQASGKELPALVVDAMVICLMT